MNQAVSVVQLAVSAEPMELVESAEPVILAEPVA